MHPDKHDDEFDDAPAPLSISRLAAILRRYLGVITIALAAVVCGYLIVALALLVTSARQTTVSRDFRLTFKGAEVGEYPNGLNFSVNDITATPILRDVFEANELSRFVTFDKFNRSIFVLESNRELERLRAEYQGRLSDPKLTPMDRERIEREFETKRGSISKSDYQVQFVRTPAVRRIPDNLIPKILGDVLRTWARRAAVEKKALHFNAAVLSANVLAEIERETSDPLVRMLLLRRRIEGIMTNIEEITASLPGANLVRAGQSNVSLAEVRLMLDELVRFRLEPLIASSRTTGLVGDFDTTLSVLRAQLAYDERMYAAAKAREAALRETLLIYESQRPTSQSGSTSDAPAGASLDRADPREAVMPQLSEGFLDRIVSLSERNADREYRQSLSTEIKKASLAAIPLASAVQYDRELLDMLRTERSPLTTNPQQFESEWRAVMEDARDAVKNVNEIFLTASRLLYPETELYRATGPPAVRTSRAISIATILIGGLLTLLVSLPLILVGVFLHNRIREELGQ